MDGIRCLTTPELRWEFDRPSGKQRDTAEEVNEQKTKKIWREHGPLYSNLLTGAGILKSLPALMSTDAGMLKSLPRLIRSLR